MPTNSPENRNAYPHLIGHGSDLDQRPEYDGRNPGIQGPKTQQLRRMARYPETLFVRRYTSSLGWDPVCRQPNCFASIKCWDFQVAKKRDCKMHRDSLKKRKGDPSNLRNPLLKKLRNEGKIIERPRHDGRAGESILCVECEENDCKELILVSLLLRGMRPICELHRSKYIVAGHPTRSNELWKDRDIIVSWQKRPGKDCLRPMSACTTEGCKTLVPWKRDWGEKWKKNRRCLECVNKYGRLGPWEGLYNMLLASAGQAGRAVGLTLEQFAQLCNIEECHYCGVRIERRKFKDGTNIRSSAYFLDRKVDSIDYVYGNVVVCCTPCNYTRNNWLSYEEMLVIGAMRSGRKDRAAKLAQAEIKDMDAHVARVKIITHLRLAKWGRRDRQTKQAGRRARIASVQDTSI